MKLEKYDGKCIRLTDIYEHTYEGICSYNNQEYTYHEFGVNEESIQLICTLFYKSQIKEIKSLEKKKGPYGKFSEKYGDLEKEIVEDGPTLIEEVLDSEEEIHTIRMLDYIIEGWLPNNQKNPIKKEIIDLLKKYHKYMTNNEIKEKIERIIES